MVRKVADFLGVSTEAVWKVAFTLVGYLVMGAWLTAKISTEMAMMQSEVKEIKVNMQELQKELWIHTSQQQKGN
jgi:hypothetical protein